MQAHGSIGLKHSSTHFYQLYTSIFTVVRGIIHYTNSDKAELGSPTADNGLRCGRTTEQKIKIILEDRVIRLVFH